MTGKEELKTIKKARKAGKVPDLSYEDLSYADLEDADLTDASLEGADLSYADLKGANLRDANLRYVNLIGADLTGANLRGADLEGANLTDAILLGADLCGTDIVDMYAGKDFLFYQPETGYLKIGCKGMHIKEWQKKYKAIGKEQEYSDSEIELYGLAIEMLAKIVIKEK